MFYQQQQDTISKLNLALAEKDQTIELAEQLLNTLPEDTKALIDNKQGLHPVIEAGFLRLYKPHLLGEFESKIDDVLNSDVTTYPNYDQIESILQQAKVYYPDSHKIEVLALDIQSSKHSTLLSIARQINSHLENPFMLKLKARSRFMILRVSCMRSTKTTRSHQALLPVKFLDNT